MRHLNYTVAGCLLLCANVVHAQTSKPDSLGCAQPLAHGSPIFSQARSALAHALSLLSRPPRSDLFRASSLPARACTDRHPFLRAWSRSGDRQTINLLPWEAYSDHQSAYPRSVNDGAGWHGAGWNLAATAGVEAQWRFLKAGFAPELYYHQNSDFRRIANTRPDVSEFANPYHRQIDFPNQFGADGFASVNPGQSYLQANAGPVSATASTENLWLGAARVHPILLSYTAPGFPHLRIGTQAPLSLPFVNVEFQLLFASLQESDYFDENNGNDDHYFTTTMVVLQPKFLPQLFVGVARAYHDSAGVSGQDIDFFTSRLIETPFGAGRGGNRVGNGIAVVLLRWVLPSSGFEAYAEWAKEDTPGGWVDILREPDWTQAYVLGFTKTLEQRNSLIRLYGELTHLSESAPARAGRGLFSYYTHSVVSQGHTHRGQILGAGIGPGSNAQLVGVDVFTSRARTALRLERTRFDDDTYYRRFAFRWGETRHDTELTLSARRTQLFGPIDLEAGLALSRRYNRDFTGLEDEQSEFVENNWQLHIGGSWHWQR